jgi:hypothetical protein
MKRLAIAIGALFLMGATAMDWKLYGTSMLGREEMRSFYGTPEVMPNGHMQVSTEELTSEGLAVAEQSDPAHGRASEKFAAGYRPPFAGLHTLSNGELVNAIEYEEIANSAAVTPRIQTVRELDCTGKRMRVLSQIQDGMEVDAEKLNLSWERVLPSTASANLLQLVCR